MPSTESLRFMLYFFLSLPFISANSSLAAEPLQMNVVTGYSIIENQAVVKVENSGESTSSLFKIFVVDQSHRDWKLTVESNVITVQAGDAIAADPKEIKAKQVGELKLDGGKSYRITAKPVEINVNGKANSKVNAPQWLVITNGSDRNAMDQLVQLVSGFENSATDQRLSRVRTNREGSSFTPPMTRLAWENRKRELQEQLLVTQGIYPMWPKTDLHPKVIGKLDRGDFTIEKVALQTLPGFYLGGNLYRPKQVKGKLPAILSPHGHYADGRVNEAVQARCIRLAKLGFIVFMYDMVGYNDSKTFGHTFSNPQLDQWGLNLVGFQTFHSIRALDWLESLPDVDSARIGCTGESGGGTQTFFLTAVDDRIAAAAPVVMISEGFQGGCVCENAAGMRLGTDNVEIGAMFAPKPLQLVGATGDWTVNTMTIVHPTISKVYSLYGRSDLITATMFNFDHNYNRVSRNAVYPFFMKWLQNKPNSPEFREPELSFETPETLLVQTDLPEIAKQAKSPKEMEEYLIKMRQDQINRLLFAEHPEQWQAAKQMLRTIHRVRVGASQPAASELITKQVEADLLTQGIQVIKTRVGRKSIGDAVPVVELYPSRHNGTIVVFVSASGLSGLIGSDGRLQPMVDQILKAGSSVIAFDSLFVGANGEPASASVSHPETAHADCYNLTVAQDHAQDLATVVAFAKSRSENQQVHLVGVGDGAALTLWTRPVLEGIGRTLVKFPEGGQTDDDHPTPKWTGWEQAGGLQGAASLTSPFPLWIDHTQASINISQLNRKYQMEGVESQLKTNTHSDSSNFNQQVRWLLTGE